MERLKVETNSEVKKKKKRNIFSIEQSQLSTTKRKVKMEREISFPRFIFPLWIIEFAKSEFISEK